MNKKLLSLMVAGSLSQAVSAAPVEAAPADAAEAQRPNIIYIMSDDHAVRAVSA